jgi:hypothetical protein
MRYIAAITACVAEGVLWATISVVVFGWERGGGAIPMVILFAVMGFTWRRITRRTKAEGDS